MCDSQNYRVSCGNILCMKDCHWPVFTSVKTNSSHQIFILLIVKVLASFRTGIAVSGLMLRLKAKEFSDDPEFKASLCGYKKWKRRHSVSLRIKTEDLEQQKLTFHRFVITFRQRHGYSLLRIFNMDKTPMRFELPSSRTFEFSNDCILFLYFRLAYK